MPERLSPWSWGASPSDPRVCAPTWKLSEPHTPGVPGLSGGQAASGSPASVTSLEQKMLQVPFAPRIFQGISGALCREPGGGQRPIWTFSFISHPKFTR